MDVEDGLPSMMITIEYKAIAILGNIVLACQLLGSQDESGNNLRILVADVVDCCNLFLRNNKNMYRRLGIDIPECDHFLILIFD